jgi:hypothetical protein
MSDEHGVDRREPDLAGASPWGEPSDVAQHPFDLRSAEIGIQHQSRAPANEVTRSFARELGTALGRSAILPDDPRTQGQLGRSIESEDRLALIRDAQRDLPARLGMREDLGQYGVDRIQDVSLLVLDPARAWEGLRELPGCAGQGPQIRIEEQPGHSGRAGIQADQASRHSRRD